MGTEDYKRCIMTIPEHGITVEGIATGNVMEIRQGSNTVRFPAAGEGMQEVFDAIDGVHSAMKRSLKTKLHYDTARAILEKQQLQEVVNGNEGDS